MRKIAVLLFLIFALQVAGIQAQTLLTGKDVPDAGAFRLWANSRTSEGELHDLSDVAQAGVSPAGIGVLKQVLKTWRNNYDAARIDPNGTSRWPKEHQLTLDAMADLKNSVSTDDSEKFLAYLQTKKGNMGLSNVDISLPASVRKQNLDESQMVAMAGMPQGQTMTPNYSSYLDMSFGGSYTAVDNFQRANGSIGPNWTVPIGALGISNNTEVTTATPAVGYNNQGTWATGDGCTGANLAVLPSSGGNIGITSRESTDGKTYYYALWTTIPGNRHYAQVGKSVNGTITGIHNIFQAAVGDAMMLCAEGTTITATIIPLNKGSNEAQTYSFTDTSISSGFPGIIGSAGGALASWWASSEAGWYVDAQISGDTICSLGCPSGAFHTPQITNGDGTIGGTEYGSPVQPQYQIDFFNNQTYTAMWQGEGNNFGSDLVQTSGQINCTLVGVLWSGSGNNGFSPYIGIQAITMYQNTQVMVGDFGWTIAQRCSTATNPPDWNDTAYINSKAQPPPPPDSPFWKGKTICYRKWNATGQPWNCAPGTTVTMFPYSVDGATEEFILHGDGFSKYNCTNFDRNINGKPWP
jgi:hypothetical protein